MSINLDNISAVTRTVDTLIQVRGVQNDLTEESVEELIDEAIAFVGLSFSDEEKEAAKRDITWKYQIYTTPGTSILSDYEQDNWYDDAKGEIVPDFWTRYKDYLIDKKHFSPNVVSALGQETLDQKLMNYILNPNGQYQGAVLRRGIVIGDVQSGKTSTYIGFICKAADAGYKVFILLTGTIESLRKQTQERVEEGFIGIDMSAGATGGVRVGVGEDNKPIKAMALTSRKGDFAGDSDKIAVALSDKNSVVFVIKKQKNVLTKLKDWLISLNADPVTHKIDMPMIMIDDEADNASINTSKDKEDPTTINRLIRELASVFTKSNYIGFTATPYANVFIDPETTEKMETQDLFPEDFIVTLPTPSNYIGPTRIFPENSEFHSQINYINDAGREEEDGYSFYFKHKKDWEGELPKSLTDAIYTFYLANAIRDLRGDFKEHRSMLINISRFMRVQQYVKEEVEQIHSEAYRSVKYNLSHDYTESMKDPVLKRIYDNWEKEYGLLEFNWDQIVNTLFKSLENIEIKVVNSSRNSEKLDYSGSDSIRVIAIGGLALSRGLTLEGLIISYFYRNTCTYDVLMQMGRWFGYRRNYEDLFRIWTHKSSATWYAEIAEATEKLKEDMEIMRSLKLKPRDFGIRVRNDSDELRITAYNKMRNATDEYEITSYFGKLMETPYSVFDPAAQKKNYSAVCGLIDGLVNSGYSFERQNGNGRFMVQDVPKTVISAFLRKLSISKYSYDFDIRQITEFIDNTAEECIAKFDIAFMEGKNTPDKRTVRIAGNDIILLKRNSCIVSSDSGRLSLGQRGKLGGPGDGKAGINDYQGSTADEIILKAEADFRDDYLLKNGYPFDPKRTYPSNTWFRYVEKRCPLLLIYLIEVDVDKDDESQKKQIDQFNKELQGTPVVGFALGLPRNDSASGRTGIKYKANKVYNWFERDEILAEGDEEE